MGDLEFHLLEFVDASRRSWLDRLLGSVRWPDLGTRLGGRFRRLARVVVTSGDENREQEEWAEGSVHVRRLLTGHCAEVECVRMSVKDLSIVRHGIAEDHNPDDPSDHARRLTDLGLARVVAAARGMEALGVQPHVLWSSPHVRALQTAEAIAAVLKPAGGLDVRESLSFRGGSMAVRTELRQAEGAVMVVGHEPILSDLASELCAHGRLRLHLKKCSLVRMSLYDLPNGLAGELLGYLPPRALRMIGASEPAGELPSEQS